MNLTICWNDVAGYTAACWQALARRSNINLSLVLFDPKAGVHQSFSETLLKGLNYHILDNDQRDDAAFVRSVVCDTNPDTVIMPGWAHPCYRQLAGHRELRNSQFIMTMDNPWKATIRQYLARVKIGKFLRRLDGVFVAGERSWQFARRLGIPEARIFRGVYGFDLPLFTSVYEHRLAAGAWPKRFLFVGRYVIEKGFDTLLPAYQKYRDTVVDPWPISFCGRGPFQSDIGTVDGTEDRGFIQPDDLPGILAEHGVFILSSRREHWSVALAEAMAAGTPAISTEEVGASIDLIRNCYNGLTVPTNDIDAMADAMRWMHEHYHAMPDMGRRAREFASAHSAELWADRVIRMIGVIAHDRSGAVALDDRQSMAACHSHPAVQ